MLKDNQIILKDKTLIKLFSLVNPLHPAELTLNEFVKFSFDPKADQGFRKVIKKIRKSHLSKTVDKKQRFLPYSFTTLLNFLSNQAIKSEIRE